MPIERFIATRGRIAETVESDRAYAMAANTIEARLNFWILVSRTVLLGTVAWTIVDQLVRWGPDVEAFLTDTDRHAQNWAQTMTWLQELWQWAHDTNVKDSLEKLYNPWHRP